MPKKKINLKCNGCCPANGVLKANVTPPAVVMPSKISFNHRHVAKINVGLDVEVPKGYRLCVKLADSLAERGMVLTNAPGNFTNGSVFVVLLNAGREIVDVVDGDPVAEFWLEQVVEWECVCE